MRDTLLEVAPNAQAARRVLAEVGIDPQFGARPLRRAVQRLVVDPLTAKILAGEIRDGSEVRVDARNGTISLSSGKAKEAGALRAP